MSLIQKLNNGEIVMKLVIKVRGIEYDTDGEIVDLPESMKLVLFDDDDFTENDELITNRLSDESDYCVDGWELESFTIEK
jgi:hypothetical protein